MKKFIYVVLLLLLPVFSIAQQNPYCEEWNKEQLNSLRLIWYNSTNDTLRLGLARSYGFYYQESNFDSGFTLMSSRLYWQGN